MSENTGGRLRRDPAGISSDKPSENLGRRKSKVSWERLIRSGSVGPKARPSGVADGHPVNIPELRWRRLTKGGRGRISESGDGYPDLPAQVGLGR